MRCAAQCRPGRRQNARRALTWRIASTDGGDDARATREDDDDERVDVVQSLAPGAVATRDEEVGTLAGLRVEHGGRRGRRRVRDVARRRRGGREKQSEARRRRWRRESWRT